MKIQHSILNSPQDFSPPPPEKGARRVVWVPGEYVLTMQVVVPGRHWRQALPYAVEPHLAQPLETQEVIPLTRNRSNGKTACAVVDKALLAQWQAALTQAGWGDAVILPDYLSVPAGQGWQAACEDGRCCVRVGEAIGFSAPETVAHALAQQAEASLEQAVKHPEGAAQLLRFGLNKGQGANQTLHGVWRQWRGAVLLAAAVLGAWLGQLAWETHRLNQQADAYKQQTVALFQKVFPNVKRVVNIRAQLQGQLQQLQKQSTHPWAEVLAAVQQAGAKVKAIEWQAGRGKLVVEAHAPSVLERLNTEIPALNLKQKRKTKTGQWEGVYAIGT